MLANLDRQKFIELLGKLGSETDEDALSAARDLHAQVTVAQISWDDLLVPDQVDAPVAGDDGEDDDGDSEDDDNLLDEDDEKDLTDEEKSEALSLIDKISALEISKGTKEELKEYKQLFDEGLISEEEYKALKKKALDL